MIDYKVSPGTGGNTDLPERYDDLPDHNIEVFQSENIQNILDAKSSDKDTVEIDYEIRKLLPSERENLKNLLGPDFFNILKMSFDKSQATDIKEQKRRVELALSNEDHWFSLIIKEKNTTGLTGDETGETPPSKFHALMRAINKSEKDGVLGGTFGKGSSVYTFTSGLWLWFAYSILESKWEKTDARFLGRGLIAPFVDYEARQSYHGPIWYAREEEVGNRNKHQGLPFINSNAHKEAARFNIPKRDKDDFGTTYMIPVFWPSGFEVENMNHFEIRKVLLNEIIKKWFPTIYSGHLTCKISISGENTITIDKGYMKTIPELKYKLEILDWYYGGQIVDSKYKLERFELRIPRLKSDYWEKYPFAKNISKTSLDLVVRVITNDDTFHGFLDSEQSGTLNRIALTRNKGMIVNHFPWLDSKLTDIVGNIHFEGMLFAGRMLVNPSSDIDQAELFLGFSENPAHNEWIDNILHKNRCHLERFDSKTLNPYSRIKQIYRSIETIIGKFFPKDDKPPIKEEVCTFWKNLYKVPFIGDRHGGKSNYSYSLIKEGFSNSGEYEWIFKFDNTNEDSKVRLIFSQYILSHEGPIRSIEDFEKIGIQEFSELKISEDGVAISEVVLGKEEGLSRTIEIKTCSMAGNPSFHNLIPLLEINDLLD